MKYTISINQCAIATHFPGSDLDITDWAILDFVCDWYGSTKGQRFICDEKQYLWIDHATVASEMPCLGIKKEAVKKRLFNLCRDGFLEKKLFNLSYPAYRPTEKADLLKFEGGKTVPGGVGNPSHRGREIRPTNSSITDSSINDIANEPIPMDQAPTDRKMANRMASIIVKEYDRLLKTHGLSVDGPQWASELKRVSNVIFRDKIAPDGVLARLGAFFADDYAKSKDFPMGLFFSQYGRYQKKAEVIPESVRQENQRHDQPLDEPGLRTVWSKLMATHGDSGRATAHFMRRTWMETP